MVCASALQEVAWLKRFFDRLSIARTSKGPIIILHCDSQESITYINDPKCQHIDIKYNFLKDAMTSGKTTLQYTPTHEI